MVTTSGFTHAPVSRFLIFWSVASSILVSVLDVKHLISIKPNPHLWPFLQFSRLLTFQLSYTSSTELFFSAALLYQFRVLERLWGSRKYASFVATVVALNLVLLPGLTIFFKVATFGVYNYLPAGSVSVCFAALGAWADEVPRLYRWKIVTSTNPGGERRERETLSSRSSHGAGTGGAGGGINNITLSDKTTTYALAAQLALSQFPYQLLPAAVGWTIGSAWTGEILPVGLSRWRVPPWMVGEAGSQKGRRGQYEGLRRRLEEEGSSADGMRNVSDNVHNAATQDERRGFGRQILGYFTGS